MGFKNSVAICGNEISAVQCYLLRSLDANIILAFDEDIDEEHIKRQAKQFKTRKVFYIFDDLDLLDRKMSPVDVNRDTWIKLYNNLKMI